MSVFNKRLTPYCVSLPYLASRKPLNDSDMKKILAVLALALFLGGIAVPAAAAILDVNVSIEFMEEDPKKKTAEKASAEKKADSEKTTSEGCASSEKAAESSKSTKKSDCAKTCGGS